MLSDATAAIVFSNPGTAAENPVLNRPFVPAPEYHSYSQVPFYRKRWFIALAALFFAPLGAIVAMSGDIYLCRRGKVFKFAEKHKTAYMVVTLGLTLLGILRFFAFMARPFV